ncbi:MAG TPA: PBP1A family penicillin-binding protein, partial [Pyrinomonadaceae bacterium]|nr:PBP1A family penicillin-binding protein [Pyrinomonadaceae bacterium]
MQETPITKSTRSKMPPGGWKRSKRVSAYQAKPKSRFRRLLCGVFNIWTGTFALILLLAGFLGVTYFWFEYSDRIDRKLLGSEIFTPTAGIYSAPKTLKAGDAATIQDLIEYLKSAGYIEKNAKADQARSRYSILDGRLLIEPGATAVINGTKVFPVLSVKFAKDGKSVEAIQNVGSGRVEPSSKLEPKMLSTIAAEGDGRRKVVNFADLPPHLIKAITVTEDRAFFEHYGVNFRGIARAAWRRYEGDDDSPIANQGGSSITQQLVKNLLLTNEPTLERKAKEAFMSIILETRLSKQEIFALYANQIYLGQQLGVSIYGVGEASNVYFGKDVTQLTVGESAFLAGIIRSPNRYNPFKNLQRVTERRNQVLDSMLEAGEISPEQHYAARNSPLDLKQISSKKDLQGMPYFSQHVLEEMPKLISDPEALQHMRVYTSIDPDLQRIAYETVNKRLERLDKFFPKKAKGNLNASLVAIRPKTGEIVAMVGGRDYLENQFNRATSAMRQPGSVFKPFVYTAAINSAYDTASRVFTAATILKDEKKVFTFGNDSYAPNNYGDTFSNKEVTLRDALVKSKNTITVDVGMQCNIGRVMNLANKAGMPKVEKAYPSMALGTAEATPLQVATAYTMFANLGDRVAPMPITQITNGDGSTVVLSQPDKKNVVRSDVAYIMTDIMKDVINRGTAAEAKAWGFQNVAGKTGFAGKTGTSRDGWFAGFTPELVVVVYVGFDDGDDLGMKGSDSAMPIWADFMKEALERHPEWNGDWAMPAGIRKAEIDTRNGSLIREVDALEATNAKPSPSPSASPTPKDPATDDPAWATTIQPETPEIYVTEVPAEFRRIELFVPGTVPGRAFLKQDGEIQYDPETGEPITP